MRVFFILCLLLIPLSALGANPYGTADYSRRDAFTHDELVACWDLDPGVTGNIVNGDSTDDTGDFEIWDGSHGTCTDRPTGWDCSCSGDSDLESDTANYYKSNMSVKMTVSVGAEYLHLYSTGDFEPNAVYNISFWLKSAAGTEDINFRVFDNTNTQYYVFATDSWQAGVSSWLVSNIPTTWTRYAGYVVNTALNRTNVRFYLLGINANDVVYVDNFKVQKLNSSFISKPGNFTLTALVSSDVLAGDCKDCFFKEGSSTGPSQDRGLYFGDTGDFLSRADDGTFDPSENKGHFSFSMNAIPDDISASVFILVDKYVGTNGWDFRKSTDDLQFLIGDGSAFTQVTIADHLSAGTKFSSVCTYRMRTDGTGTLNIYADSMAVDTDATGEIISNSANALTIGKFSGYILDFCYWNKELSAVEASKVISPYYPGTRYNDKTSNGFYQTACTNTASHATCSWDRCRDGTATKCEAEGTGSYAAFAQYTELIENNSGETNTGTDVAADYTNWNETLTAGDGTATIQAYYDDSLHGSNAIRIKLTGTTSTASLTSDCQTAGVGSDVFLYYSVNKREGTSLTSMGIQMFSDGGCSTPLAYDWFVEGDIEFGWQEFGNLQAAADWDGGANSYKVIIKEEGDNGVDLLVDNISVKEASYRTPWVHAPASGGAVTYTSRALEVHNPTSDYISENNAYVYKSGWCLSSWVWTGWDISTDSTTRYIFRSEATAGNDNLWVIYKTSSNEIRFYVWDSGGDNLRARLSAATTTQWSVSGWKYIEICTSGDGTVVGHHYNDTNNTWYDWAQSGTGTGVQDAQASELFVGTVSTSHIDGYIHDFAILPYSASYPNHGFNGGKPPPDPY